MTHWKFIICHWSFFLLFLEYMWGSHTNRRVESTTEQSSLTHQPCAPFSANFLYKHYASKTVSFQLSPTPGVRVSSVEAEVGLDSLLGSLRSEAPMHNRAGLFLWELGPLLSSPRPQCACIPYSTANPSLCSFLSHNALAQVYILLSSGSRSCYQPSLSTSHFLQGHIPTENTSKLTPHPVHLSSCAPPLPRPLGLLWGRLPKMLEAFLWALLLCFWIRGPQAH